MLTKDLLKYSSRSGRVYPQKIELKDKAMLSCCTKILAVFNSARGKKQHEIKELIDDELGPLNLIQQGCLKLVFDRCSFSEPSAEVETQRWNIILAAEEMRKDHLYQSQEEYERNVQETLSDELSEVGSSIYSDLPEHKTVESYKTITPTQLIHRYNCAQIQGLLLQAREIQLKVKNADLSSKRALFRLLKFHQIIAHATKTSGKNLEIELSGPLSIFDGSQSYGMRIANFFPHVLNLKEFDFSALIKTKKGEQKILITEKDGVESHYSQKNSYIPDELTSLTKEFQSKQNQYELSLSADAVDLGKQNFCFPDFRVTHKTNKKSVHIELFHRWHKGQLQKRLEILASCQNRETLILGICRKVSKDKQVQSSLANLKDSCCTFIFSDFPSSSLLLKSLDRVFAKQSSALFDSL